jgi:hypothetical protein
VTVAERAGTAVREKDSASCSVAGKGTRPGSAQRP